MSRQASVSPLPETIILDTIVVRTGGHGIIPAARRLEKLHVLHSSTKGNCGVEETNSEDDTSTDGSISPVNKSLIVTLKVNRQKMAEVLNKPPAPSAAQNSEYDSAQVAREKSTVRVKFRYKWKDLQFKIRHVAMSVLEHGPRIRLADLPPSNCIDWLIQRQSLAKRKSKQIRYEPLVIEASLWQDVLNTVFRSKGSNNLTTAMRSLKDTRTSFLKASPNTSPMSDLLKWFVQGRNLLKPLSQSMVREMIQRDCPFVNWLVRLAKQGKNQFRIDDELCDIFTLALELDDMRMKSHTFITLDNGILQFQEDLMDARHMNGDDSLNNFRMHFFVSPVVFSSDTWDDADSSKKVLIKGEVVIY